MCQTDRQNYDSQDRAGIAASRGKNGGSNIVFTEATVPKTTEAAASVASNVATALSRLTYEELRCCGLQWCKAPFTRYNLLSNRLSNRFDDRFDNWLYRV